MSKRKKRLSGETIEDVVKERKQDDEKITKKIEKIFGLPSGVSGIEELISKSPEEYQKLAEDKMKSFFSIF